MEVHKRNKELVKLQQKIVALLVKGNDHARRRLARRDSLTSCPHRKILFDYLSHQVSAASA